MNFNISILKKFIGTELLKLNEANRWATGKILYLHGLDSSPEKDGISVLQIRSDYRILAPQLEYRAEDIWNQIEEIIKDSKPIAVMGHSVGGYLAFYYSNWHHIPALMFMPAFKDKDTYMLSIPKKIKNLPAYKSQIAVLGLEDDVIDIKDQMEELNNGRSTADIYKEKIGHDITKSILTKYFNLFIKNYL